ncbi:hypothetical protein B296_00044232 [Ensete ventricosum]|uniref:Uncharacterized protein n=1 Tax=Ensete ventricosum TaxID=4639 RepID=A0A426Z560_ENSVE|nr:hypothetical protein B296_00044232 [Ensete ventricosum]
MAGLVCCSWRDLIARIWPLQKRMRRADEALRVIKGEKEKERERETETDREGEEKENTAAGEERKSGRRKERRRSSELQWLGIRLCSLKISIFIGFARNRAPDQGLICGAWRGKLLSRRRSALDRLQGFSSALMVVR